MINKNKLLRKKHTLEKQGEDRNSSKALEMPSSRDAPVLNENL